MKKIIIANWKCNPTTAKEAQKLLLALKAGAKKAKPEMVVCPPFVYLPEAARILKPLGVKLGSQNCFWEEKGAFTGEISPYMLKDLGVKYVIVGHSERRGLLREDEETVNKKLGAVLGANLVPILCIGETAEQKKQGLAFSVLEKEIKEGLKKIPKAQIASLIIAYEPIWAIGAQNPCSADEALTVSLFIRKVVGKIYGRGTAKILRVIYGGSVNSQNYPDYLNSDWLNGLLVGGASLNIQEFLKMTQ